MENGWIYPLVLSYGVIVIFLKKSKVNGYICYIGGRRYGN